MLRPREDRVLDWREELARIRGDLPELPEEARFAVARLLAAFEAEDGDADAVDDAAA